MEPHYKRKGYNSLGQSHLTSRWIDLLSPTQFTPGVTAPLVLVRVAISMLICPSRELGFSEKA